MAGPKKTTRARRSRRPAVAPEAAQPAPISMSAQQIQQAATAGLDFLGRETTLWPGNLHKQLAVLEVILQGVMAGKLIVVTPQQVAVESKPNHGGGSR